MYVFEFSFLIGWLFESIILTSAAVPQKDEFPSVTEAGKPDS